MPRINPTVSKEAFAIYDKLDRNDRGHWVSEAIIEKKERETNTSIEDIIKSAIEEHIRIYHKE